MKKLLKNKKIVFFDIDYTLFNVDIFKKSDLKRYENYQEVENVLKILSKKFSLGIFSEGEENFQREKLNKTGIEKYLDQGHIYIMQGKNLLIKKTFERYKENTIFLVDDKLTILSQVKSIYPNVFTIWVKRGEYAEKQESIKGFIPDVQVTDLNELRNIIQ